MTSELSTSPQNGDLVRVENPLQLLNRMITNGADPEKLGQMISLVERWQENHAKAEFAVAMNKCQSELPVIPKTNWNDQTKSYYANLNNINAAITPVYSRNGFSVSFDEGEKSLIEGCSRFSVEVLHKAGWSKKHYVDMPHDGVGIKGSPMMTKTHGKVSTIEYARRKLLDMAFNLNLGQDDDDGNKAGFIGLNDDQTVRINELIEDVRERAPTEAIFKAWLAKFWKWISEEQKSTVADLNGVHQSQFGNIVQYLEKKAKGEK